MISWHDGEDFILDFLELLVNAICLFSKTHCPDEPEHY
jgi:hypothetical protein